MKQGSKLLILLLLLYSCGPMGESQNDRPGTNRVAVDQLIFEFQYLSHARILANEGLSRTSPPGHYQKRQKDLEQTAWFLVRFSTRDSQQSPLRHQIIELAEYNDRLNYYNNRAVQDISLLYAGEPMPLNSYWFENNYNLTPWETILISFKIPDSEPARDLQLIYNDRVFNNGIIKSLFAASTIESL